MDPLRSDNKSSASQGFAALISVIILGAIASTIAVSLLTHAIQSGRTSLSKTDTEIARLLADTCMETALNKLRANQSYSGDEQIVLGDGACTILPLEGSGNTRILKTRGEIRSMVRKATATTSQLSPTIILSSWSEVADF